MKRRAFLTLPIVGAIAGIAKRCFGGQKDRLRKDEMRELGSDDDKGGLLVPEEYHDVLAKMKEDGQPRYGRAFTIGETDELHDDDRGFDGPKEYEDHWRPTC